jgi:hypothetical protein
VNKKTKIAQTRKENTNAKRSALAHEKENNTTCEKEINCGPWARIGAPFYYKLRVF